MFLPGLLLVAWPQSCGQLRPQRTEDIEAGAGLAGITAVYFSAVQCSAVQCSAGQCRKVQCSAVQCSAVQ